MSTNGIIAIIVIVVIIVGGIFLLGRDGTETDAPTGEETSENMEETGSGGAAGGTVPAGSEGAGTFDDTPGNTEGVSEGATEEGTQGQTTPPSGGNGTPSEEPAPAPEGVQTGAVIAVTYTDADGFSPSTVTISKGDTVTWTNNSGRPMWVASAIHPTHTVYPEKTAGDCLGSAFDACEGVPVGETFTFTFNRVGEWGYHDHLKASQRGKVIVE